MLHVKGLKKSFKNKVVLNEINFNINEGEIVAYLGPNGAGKTTTIKCICGLNTLNSGIVELNKHRIGVVFDENGLYPLMTAYENLLFFAKLSQLENLNQDINIDKMLNLVGLNDVKNQKVKTFSKGMKRRVALARILIFQPEILILDEPFEGLDIVNHNYMINFLKKWVKENNRCIMFSSHNMQEINDFCDRVIILNNGNIIADDSVIGLLHKNIKGTRVYLRHETDVKKSVILFEQLTDSENIYTDGNSIFISQNQAFNQEIHDILINNGVDFNELSICHSSLEEIYINYISGKI